MKTLLVAFACIPLLAACKKDEPVPVTTVPAVVAPAETATPASSTPPAAQSMDSPAVTTSTTTPEPASSAVGSSTAAAMQGSGSGQYVVEQGDTLWSIAAKNDIKHGDLEKWNNINDPRELQVGRELTLAAP